VDRRVDTDGVLVSMRNYNDDLGCLSTRFSQGLYGQKIQSHSYELIHIDIYIEVYIPVPRCWMYLSKCRLSFQHGLIEGGTGF
jgi:hypothetical protein